jgi:hypothetical protein
MSPIKDLMERNMRLLPALLPNSTPQRYIWPMWLTVQCTIAIAFSWWLIWLGERDLRAVGFAGLLVAFAFTATVSWLADWFRYRRVGRS